MDQPKQNEIKNSSTIFINPKFKAHINPNFLNNVKPVTATNNIFINPKFISNLSNNGQHELPSEKIAPPPQAKIIKQTSRNLIRQPMLKTVEELRSAQSTNLIKIGKRKLVRPSAQPSQEVKVPVDDKKVSNIRTKYKIVNKSLNIYKIDRTRARPAKDRTPKRIKYFNDLINPTKVVVTDFKLCRIASPKVSLKSREYNSLNINGVLYKSSITKLQKQSVITGDKQRQLNRQSSNSNACSLYVCGEKFLLDPSGKKLERVSNNKNGITKNRIYLGGLTYIAKSNNTYERTNSHNTRLHLNVAKQKSINLLSKNLVKSNVSCQIYRKLGKCLGLQRGRCAKVHDRNQVAICQKFLKGTCTNENCLLSHDASLSKMPTCKFFLLGQCVKSDCQYLHKKVNDKTAICQDFLKGYCPKAEKIKLKCNLRHEFLCPNFESMEGCSVTRCPYVHKKKAVIPAPPTATPVVQERGSLSINVTENNKRYFVNNNKKSNDNQKSVDPSIENNVIRSPNLEEETDEKSHSGNNIECETNEDLKPKRKMLGKLPSFIPIH